MLTDSPDSQSPAPFKGPASAQARGTIDGAHEPLAGLDRDALFALDARHVWHPFTPHQAWRDDDPLMVVDAEGHHLIDADGRRLLDGVSSLWCTILGHRHPHLDAAVRAQLDRVAHATFLGNANGPAVTLAARLIALAPEGLSRVFYSDSGSTAVEVALKMAWQFWQQCGEPGAEQRRRFLTFAEAYHGDTVGAVSVGGVDLFHARYGGLLFETLRAPSPSCYRHPDHATQAEAEEAAVQAFEAMVARHGPELAAIVVEPGMQGAAGLLSQPAGFLKRVRAAADRAGCLLIVDEVAMGFGRSANALFACDTAGITADFICLAKGLTGGYLPLAATLTTERVFGAFLGAPSEGRTFFHGHTFTGNCLGAAVAHAVLDVFEKTDLLSTLPVAADHYSALLAKLARHPAVGDVRQYGLAMAVELVADRASKRAFPATARVGMQVCTAARDHGVFVRPLGDVLVLMPPLTLTAAEREALVGALAAALADVLGPIAEA